MPPVALEQGERRLRGPVLPGREVGQPWCGAVGAQHPAADPVVHTAQAVRVVELGGEHRGDPERQQVAAALGREPLHDVEHGEVGVCP